MPRQARLDAPGTLHHVIMRGNEKTRDFRSTNKITIFLPWIIYWPTRRGCTGPVTFDVGQKIQ